MSVSFDYTVRVTLHDPPPLAEAIQGWTNQHRAEAIEGLPRYKAFVEWLDSIDDETLTTPHAGREWGVDREHPDARIMSRPMGLKRPPSSEKPYT